MHRDKTDDEIRTLEALSKLTPLAQIINVFMNGLARLNGDGVGCVLFMFFILAIIGLLASLPYLSN